MSLSDWYTRQPPPLRVLIVAVFTFLVSFLPPQLLEDLRPKAPALVPDQQAKLDQAVKTAAEVREMLGWGE